MDWQRLIELGAQYIQNNDDDATTGIDLGDIANALQSVLGSKDGGLDLSGLVQQVQDSGLMEVVASWIGSGENAPIEPEKVPELVSEEKVRMFAEQLGISEESAKKALADALPAVVDEATNEEPSLAEQMLAQVGGVEGAINLLKKFF
ncbi:MAG: hypothetical protein C6H99_05670 [Epsilonproteobacteria bacterium]|nr:hypothetical protein [Campylobacterota bacterium]NPA64095.1 DUF937 domain-containing protein [Campylobacterota bacterium]